MPAATASRRIAYSSVEIVGYVSLLDPPWGGTEDFLVRGKLSHRLRDLVRVGHEELLLPGVERHRRDVRRGDADDRAVEVPEGVLRDDRRHLGPEAPGQVVFMHDHTLAGLAHRLEDRG